MENEPVQFPIQATAAPVRSRVQRIGMLMDQTEGELLGGRRQRRPYRRQVVFELGDTLRHLEEKVRRVKVVDRSHSHDEAHLAAAGGNVRSVRVFRAVCRRGRARPTESEVERLAGEQVAREAFRLRRIAANMQNFLVSVALWCQIEKLKSTQRTID